MSAASSTIRTSATILAFPDTDNVDLSGQLAVTIVLACVAPFVAIGVAALWAWAARRCANIELGVMYSSGVTNVTDVSEETTEEASVEQEEDEEDDDEDDDE